MTEEPHNAQVSVARLCALNAYSNLMCIGQYSWPLVFTTSGRGHCEACIVEAKIEFTLCCEARLFRSGESAIVPQRHALLILVPSGRN